MSFFTNDMSEYVENPKGSKDKIIELNEFNKLLDGYTIAIHTNSIVMSWKKGNYTI